MRYGILLAVFLICPPLAILNNAQAQEQTRGVAKAAETRPSAFPHRIWAASDFEAQTPDFGWFGVSKTKNIMEYPGNKTALGVGAENRPYRDISAVMTGMNPVPGPMMGKVNNLYLRYHLTGTTEATFQHFSLSSEDNNYIRVSGLTEGKWSELTLNFTRDAQRNDGTPGVPFQEGERMDDLKIFAGRPADARKTDLLIDDVTFFAEDPDLPAEKEPFPNRIMYLAAFDTGIDAKSRQKYFPGDFEVVTPEKGAPKGAYWGVARAIPQKQGKGKWIRLELRPVRTVGEKTKLRFRYYLSGTSRLTAQIFDATDNDNRHVQLNNLKRDQRAWQYVDFTTDGRRNDGGSTPFAVGHKVDDLFFFVEGDGGVAPELYVDEVTLFDAGTP